MFLNHLQTCPHIARDFQPHKVQYLGTLYLFFIQADLQASFITAGESDGAFYGGDKVQSSYTHIILALNLKVVEEVCTLTWRNRFSNMISSMSYLLIFWMSLTLSLGVAAQDSITLARLKLETTPASQTSSTSSRSTVTVTSMSTSVVQVTKTSTVSSDLVHLDSPQGSLTSQTTPLSSSSGSSTVPSSLTSDTAASTLTMETVPLSGKNSGTITTTYWVAVVHTT